MSLFSRIKEYLTPKTVYVFQSKLSNPKVPDVEFTDPKKQELKVLEILSQYTQLKAREIDRIYPSWGRRLNSLLHKGLVDNIGNKRYMVYKINDRGYDLLIELITKWRKEN